MRYFLAAAVLPPLLIWACFTDYEDARAAQDQYCDMVRSGAWPAYKGSDVCK